MSVCLREKSKRWSGGNLKARACVSLAAQTPRSGQRDFTRKQILSLRDESAATCRILPPARTFASLAVPTAYVRTLWRQENGSWRGFVTGQVDCFIVCLGMMEQKYI